MSAVPTKPITTSAAPVSASDASAQIRTRAGSITAPGINGDNLLTPVEPVESGVNGFTAIDSLPLFSPTLISPEVLESLPEGYTIRPLRRSDYNTGFLNVLRVLTTVGDISLEAFNERYDFMASRNDTYYVLVICDESGDVVGTGAVVVERKFIHDLGLVGHIEDIAVAKNQQGKKLGLRIINALDNVAKNVGCYKSILDCSEANEGFYVKCGFKRAGLEMAHYYDKAAQQGKISPYHKS